CGHHRTVARRLIRPNNPNGRRRRRSGAQEGDMQGIEKDSPEEAFRRGYEIETFHAVSRLLAPAARDILRTWVEDDVYVWRLNSMRGYPPTWRLRMLAGVGLPGGVSDLSADDPPPLRASPPARPGSSS